MKVGIVGLGLIGGSMARTIQKNTANTVVGIDISAETMEKALATGAIDAVLSEDELESCGLLLLALCPQAMIQYIEEHQKEIGKDTIVVDLCGVKRAACDAVRPIAAENGFCYVGGHPMAGKEKSGIDSATEHLFRHASMILVPGEEIGEATKSRLETFFLSLGFGKIQYATAEEHDRIIAYTSQLAHVLSSAYVKTPTALSHTGFSAGSFKDMTRVATLDENMWTELFLDNADYLSNELEGLIQRLAPYAEALRARDGEALRRLLKDGREYKAEAEALRQKSEEEREGAR